VGCNCSVCRERNINEEGIKVFNQEIMPFVKSILNPKHPDYPLPLRYRDLYESLLAYSQALNYDRLHNEPVKKYYTSNVLMLRISHKLNEKFPQLIITDIAKKNEKEEIREVCEFNVGR
jgi:hypothetical protein